MKSTIIGIIDARGIVRRWQNFRQMAYRNAQK
jgi:hypothetical protein